MNDQELDAIEARANAATPGPWRCEIALMSDNWLIAPSVCGGGDYMRQPSSADAVFIESARSDIPALIAEIRRLRAIRVSPDNGGTQG